MLFNPQRLDLARKRARFTGRELSERTGISTSTFSRLQSGLVEPTHQDLQRLSGVLGFPTAFFFRGDFDTLNATAASFRSLTTMTSSERDASLAAGSIAFEVCDWINGMFQLPEPDIAEIETGTEPATAARILRAHWGIGERPIQNLVHFLEAKGIRMFSLDEKTKSVDAFSCWRNNEPYIFLNNFKTAERSRFDAAHELGHLVLHRHGGPDQRNAENEANTFASSFLMPRADVLSRASHVNTLGDIIKLKRRWRVSTAALMYRLHKLGYISDWNYRTFNIQLRQAFGDKEPEGIEREKSHVWVALLRELWKDGKTLDYIASALDLPATEVRGITFGLTAAFDSPEASRRGGLTLVK